MDYSNIKLENIQPTWLPPQLRAAMLRLDLLHPDISGNKWFKLRHNLALARAAGKHTILTFGGAYSNHIAATAAACKMAGLQSIGIIRGEATATPSHTLLQAAAQGMQLEFVSRELYRQKEAIPWTTQFPDAYLIPEGGHNAAGAQGCEAILSLVPTQEFSHIICAVGTGTTLAGLINSALPHQQLSGIVVLKGAQYLADEVASLLKPRLQIAATQPASATPPSWQLLHHLHGGGYARTSPALIDFINTFYRETSIPLDIVYTGKMMWGFRELVQQGYFPANSRILLIHSGGLQGNLSLSSNVLCF
ncbi:1-aminocyclopropane-1-carboxylate deaminase/D-cysteine desulfhydrase [Chitinophaga defluvii]|uniref:Pyridoxal-phosphate dependent enzyme n=1 Tax=Chitinophaga defluvii TaxID=3163343 RepID=A0ABV2TCX9_9BACT